MLERFVAGDLLETGPDCLSTIKTLRDSKAEHAQTSIVGISTMALIEIHGFGSADMDRYGDMGLFEQ
jgi:hypothetical protein